jgi:16S rRNA (guanine966-N2)-methyltransferase
VRIVAGEWRGRRIKAPPGERVRPTADRVREAWMSIVQRQLPGASVLDLFAGSGALGLEALSRGAVSAVFVEIAPESLRVLRDNIDALGANDASTVRRADALRFAESLPAHAFDIAFADPPYGHRAAARLAELWHSTPFARVLGVEHRVGEAMPPGGDSRRYGSTVVTFYESAGRAARGAGRGEN